MKKLGLLFVQVFAVSALFAFNNDLTIYSENGERFDVFIDGRIQNNTPTDAILIPELRGDAYQVEVVFANRRLGRIGKTVFLQGAHRDVSYALIRNRGRYELRQAQDVPKQKAHRGRNGHRISKTLPPARRGNYGYAPMATPGEMKHFMQAVRRQPFDRDRMAMSRQFIANHQLNARQAARLVRVMDFESSRVKIAKAAYDSTIDKENYHLVHQEFTFSSSSRKLDNFVYNRGAQYSANGHRHYRR